MYRKMAGYDTLLGNFHAISIQPPRKLHLRFRS